MATKNSVLGKRVNPVEEDDVSVLTANSVNPDSRFVSGLKEFLSDNNVQYSNEFEDSYVPVGEPSSVIPAYVGRIRAGTGSVDRLLGYLRFMNATIVSGCLLIPGYGCYSEIDEEGNLQECPPPLKRCNAGKNVRFKGPLLERQDAGDENPSAGPPTATELREFPYLQEVEAASFPEGIGATDFPRDDGFDPLTATKEELDRMTEEAENFSKFMSGI